MKARTSPTSRLSRSFPKSRCKPIGSLEIERVTADVTESDVDAMIERLRKQQMKYTAVTRAAATGDKVTVDFEGAIDGVAFAGGKGENVAIVLGEGRMLAQLEQGLMGAAAGEEIAIGVDFPADYRATELAGKHAAFKVDVKSVEEPSLPELDEEFCKSFGVAEGGIPKLREEVAANMRRELDQALRNRNKAVVMDRLYRDNPIDLPNALLGIANPEPAGRGDAPFGGERRLAGAAARAAGGAGAPARRARPADQRHHPARIHRARSEALEREAR